MTLHEELHETIAALELKRAKLMARLVAEELRGGDPRRVGQESSPLGRRIHIAAVKRRIVEETEAGEAPGTRGAFVAGRRYLLTQEALADELGRGTRACKVAKAKARPMPARTSPANDDDAAFEAQLLAQWRTR
jgi:hypothetical protein